MTLRDPLLVAQQLATLDELSDGRAAAAFSVGNLAMLEQFGRDPSELRPAPRMREAHRAMRSLLDTGAVDLDGEFFRYRGVFTTARAVAPRVPLLVGAMGGPLTFRLAGEVADGVYCRLLVLARGAGYVVENVRIGAERAGRDVAQLDLCASLTVAVSDDRRGGAASRPPEGGLLSAVDAAGPARAARCLIPGRSSRSVRRSRRGDVAARAAAHAGRARSTGSASPARRRRSRSGSAPRSCPAGFNHVALALADAEIPRAWAGIEIPGLPTLAEQVSLIAERVVPQLVVSV